jgi:hypothetical protein
VADGAGSSGHDFVNLNLCMRVSVVINRQIISMQLRHQNSRYGVKRGGKLPDLSKTVRATQLKYIKGRKSGNVKTPEYASQGSAGDRSTTV